MHKDNITITAESGCLDEAAWSSSSHLTSSPGENYWQFCFMLKILYLTELLVTRLKLLRQRKRMTEERAEGSNMSGARLESKAAGERSPGWGPLSRQPPPPHTAHRTCTICADEFSLQSLLRENDDDYLKVFPSRMSVPGPRSSVLKPPEELGWGAPGCTAISPLLDLPPAVCNTTCSAHVPVAWRNGSS